MRGKNNKGKKCFQMFVVPETMVATDYLIIENGVIAPLLSLFVLCHLHLHLNNVFESQLIFSKNGS